MLEEKRLLCAIRQRCFPSVDVGVHEVEPGRICGVHGSRISRGVGADQSQIWQFVQMR